MNTTNLEYLPWSWTVRPSDPNAQCPSASAILGTFAIVNVLVSLSSLALGNRIIINYLSCGYLGTPGSKGWKYMWILSLVLSLGSNALVAILIKHTPGYENDFTIAQLTVFFIARPRLGWIFMTVVSRLQRKSRLENHRRGSSSYKLALHRLNSIGFSGIAAIPAGLKSQAEVSEVDVELDKAEGYVVERPWESSFMSQFVAEIILEIINLYTTGRIVHFAAQRGYLKINQEYYTIPRGARMFYAGALLFTITLPLMLCFSIYGPILALIDRQWRKMRGYFRPEEKKKDDFILGRVLGPFFQLFVFLLAITTWLASWLLWSGYVLLMGNLYCPPKLFQQGVIWTTFHLVSISAGSGF